ncbi:hypothetical protein D3C85_1578100 [compost metagenome]
MNTTKVDSLVVVSMACFNSEMSRRRFIIARMMAPTAPMAPPSVGVAMPRKMVPSTRKISSSGGIITSTTRLPSAAPRRVRASGGSAGTHCGFTIDTMKMNTA